MDICLHWTMRKHKPKRVPLGHTGSKSQNKGLTPGLTHPKIVRDE